MDRFVQRVIKQDGEPSSWPRYFAERLLLMESLCVVTGVCTVVTVCVCVCLLSLFIFDWSMTSVFREMLLKHTVNWIFSLPHYQTINGCQGLVETKIEGKESDD